MAGGHRKGTHNLVLDPLAAIVGVSAALGATSGWAAMLVLALTIGLAATLIAAMGTAPALIFGLWQVA